MMTAQKDIESQKATEVKNSELVPDAGKIDLGKITWFSIIFECQQCQLID
jgi:hypothetical protein